MKITKDILKQIIAEEASILQEAFGARSTGMDSMFIGQSGDSGGRSYMSFEDKQEVRDMVFKAIEEEGHDWLLDEEPFTDAIDEIGYEAETKEEFLSGIKDYLNGKEFSGKYHMNGFGDELNLKEEKGLKAKIRKAHKEEGGAAGMDALEKHTKASAKDIKAAVKDMDDVGQHKDGDYIQGDGKEIEIAKEQMSGEQKDWDKISQARLDGATDYREGRGMEDNAEKWQEVDNGIYFTDYEDGFFDAQEAEDYELDEESKKDLLKRIVAEEIAKMEIEAVLKEEEGESEIGESDFEDLLRAVAEKRVEIEYV